MSLFAIIARVIGRIALIGLALLAAACLGFTLRATRWQEEARRIVPFAPGHRTPAEIARAESLLRKAERHNPDTGPQIERAIVLAVAGRRQEAAAVLRDVLRSEPQNLRAAGVLYGDLLSFDRRAAQAVRRDYLDRLAPPVTGGG